MPLPRKNRLLKRLLTRRRERPRKRKLLRLRLPLRRH